MIINRWMFSSIVLASGIALAEPTADEAAGEYSESTTATSLSYISGTTFRKKPIIYTDANGTAIFEGDIILGTTEQLERARFGGDLQRLLTEQRPEGLDVSTKVAQALDLLSDYEAEAVFFPDLGARWPDNTVPYEIDPQLPSPARVHGAIAHWQATTSLKFVLRTNQANYVRFVPHAYACSSYVGMQRGMQPINLGPNCTQGSTIHEIGHAVGLWHEQSREDRDLFIDIQWENIIPENRHNFNQHITDGDDLGEYDFDSIMHYSPWAFALDKRKPTIISHIGRDLGSATS